MSKLGLTGNQLKIIAMITMTIDHVGMELFPQIFWMRLIGRLAFPIYAFMIAEGCSHTRSMPRYFGTMAAMAAVCQLVYWFALDSLYQCILVTFTLSIGFIWLLQKAKESGKDLLVAVVAVLGTATIWVITEYLPKRLSGTDFAVDYGFWGVMLPVFVWVGKNKWQKLLLAAFALMLVAYGNKYQMLALWALPLLALYNGQRGKWKMKWTFYFYYPVHLVVIHFIGYLL